VRFFVPPICELVRIIHYNSELNEIFLRAEMSGANLGFSQSAVELSMGVEKRLLPPHPNPLPHWGRGDKGKTPLPHPLICQSSGNAIL
jgi:hypothetical protein